MDVGKSPSIGNVALDDLIALTDEMAALVRAGVPLETGLVQVASDMSRRPAKIAAEVSQRMQTGESLLQVLKSLPTTFPPAYCAVVEAGLRSGRLPTALEGLASTSRRAAELRRLTRVALVYPMIVAFLAYGLFVASLIWFQPQISHLYQSMDAPPSAFNLKLDALGHSAYLWAPWIPLLVLTGIGIWCYRSSRAAGLDAGWLRMTPANRLLHYGRIATFADMLALLIESGTPLGPSVVLAAESGGDQRLRQAAHEFANELQGGATSPAAPHKFAGFPPLLNWLLAGGGNQTALAHSLRSTASSYRRRTLRLDEWLRLYLPLGLTIAIGGTAVVLYAVGMLGPWYQMLTRIAGAHS